MYQDTLKQEVCIPREDSQHQVQDKEGTDDDERDEVEPVPTGTQGIVGLRRENKSEHKMGFRFRRVLTLGDFVLYF